MNRLAAALATALALLAGPALDARAAEARTPIGQLAAARGCSLCHRTEPASARDAMPLAPSWREIAARYRGDPRAEERLAGIVSEGADPADLRWQERLEFTRMTGNAPRVGPEEARALARSILATR